MRGRSPAALMLVLGVSDVQAITSIVPDARPCSQTPPDVRAAIPSRPDPV